MNISAHSIKKISLWGCLALAILCSFLVFWYTDIGDTLDNGVLLAESVVKGEFLDYYEYASVNSSPYSVYPANYNVLLYAIFAIWNLPTVIIHLVTDFDYMQSCAALLWCKGIIVFALYAICIIVSKLTQKIGGSKEDGYTAGFLSISSLCVMVPALVASQYDCLSLLFMLLGLYFYAQNKNVPFILMFAIAVPLKMFAIFIFIPLLLIRFKNVLKLAGMLVAVMIPSFILELPFKGNPYYEAAMGSQNSDAIDLLLGSVFQIGKLKINLFFVAYIVICIACYMLRRDSAEKQTRLGIYFSFAVFAAFCTLVPIRSYWLILYTPFLALLCGIKKGNRTIPILADTLAGLGGGLYFLASHWIYNTGTLASRLILDHIVWPEDKSQKYAHFEGLLDSLGLWDFHVLFFTLFLGALIFCLWYLYPERSTVPADTTEFVKNKDNTLWVMLARPAILIFVCAMLIYCQFAAIPAIKYGESEYENVMDTDLMDGATVSREIIFTEDHTLSELTVHLDAYAYRSARALVGFRLTDTETDSMIWEDSVGITVIEDDMAQFDLDFLEVKRGTVYELEVYPIRPELAVDGFVCPYMDSEGELAVTIR